MNFFKQLGNFLMTGAHAHARWEIQVSETIWTDRKRLLVLLLFSVPAALGGIVFANQINGVILKEVPDAIEYIPFSQ